MSEEIGGRLDPTDWSRPVVGVLGGLGPAATSVFLDVLIRATAARSDQEHVDLLVSQHSTTPDRTAGILEPGAPDPGPVIVRDAVMLERAGVDLLVLPCNTAHHYARQVEAATTVPLLSIVETTARTAVESAAGAPIAVFATEGNIHAEVYQEAIAAQGGTSLVPDRALQDDINHLIYGQVKAGAPVDLDLFDSCIDRALEQGASTAVLGCTELSVVYDQHGYRGDARLVDSLTELARITVRQAGKELTELFR
ncbi:aspartate racemase [Brachybacterium sp. P6-10-X1]|uniref:aspartate/glutamate racemase family protein n=1 Tax=Brachybacterium sp. P6-10-X1 TaxID=1903186 RepID=UPI000971BA31|nr:amino acid racemase [Brachybacterium sp. P6-10-X1]APX31460.1 aspartate racemase [Brachybacterium sp. P6-10-X1]